jgi:hypothetical protein
MKHMKMLRMLMVLGLAVSAMGQKPAASPTPSASPAATPAPARKPPATIAASVDQEVSILETPSNLNIPGSKDVRSFAQQVKHVANTNFQLWAPVTGEKPAYDLSNDDGPDSIKTKADIIKFLKESFEAGHRAAKSLTPENSTEPVTTFFGPTPRIFATTFGVAHGFDHYGQMVEYLRMNGILPPASRGSN